MSASGSRDWCVSGFGVAPLGQWGVCTPPQRHTLPLNTAYSGPESGQTHPWTHPPFDTHTHTHTRVHLDTPHLLNTPWTPPTLHGQQVGDTPPTGMLSS